MLCMFNVYSQIDNFSVAITSVMNRTNHQWTDSWSVKS